MSAGDFYKPFVQAPVQSRPPPVSEYGIIGWLHKRLFSNTADTIITVLIGALLAYVALSLWDFFVTHATYSGSAREDCLPNPGACYPYLHANLGFFVYGFYPEAERWRVDLTAVIGVLSLAALLMPSFPLRKLANVMFFGFFPVTAFSLLYGGFFGLAVIETSYWGGMIVTFVVAIVGIVGSLPLGVLLALGRRSSLPVIRTLSILFIELWRGVPLVTVLFMASVMLPLFLPGSISPDKLLRALIGVTLFSSAYMAEVVRGGLQAIPKTQHEAATAMGLSYWQSMMLIILPQALKKVIPGIVNSFISLFKDTSLVFIVGLIDFLKAVDISLNNPNWATPWTRFTAYAFAAVFYFLCCFGMSRYSIYMERRLGAGEKGEK